MRTAVYIDDSGVFLVRIEVSRLYDAVIKIGHTVGSLDGAYFDTWHAEILIRILCCQQIDAFKSFSVDNVYFTRDIRG